MTTPVSTQSSFTYGDKPQYLAINRNGQILGSASALPGTASQHWLPTTTQAYNLGSDALRWHDLYLSGSASISGQVNADYNIVSNQNVIALNALLCGSGGLQAYGSAYPNIGSSSSPFNTAYINNISAMGSISTQNLVASTSLTVTGSSIFNGALIPAPTATHNIGSSSSKWNTVYATNIDFSGTIYQNGVVWTPVVSLPTLTGTLLPSVTATYDVGATGTRWKDGWFSGTVTADTGAFVTLTASGATTLGVTSTGALTSTSAALTAATVSTLTPLAGNGTGSLGTDPLRFASLFVNAIVNPQYTATLAVVPYPASLSDEIATGTNVGGFQQKFEDGYIGTVWANIVQPFTNGTGNVKTLGTSVNRWASLHTSAIESFTTTDLIATTGSTVGAAGAASALPATPLGYLSMLVNGVTVKVPYYTA